MVDVTPQKMNKDAQMRASINQKLIETGERERLKELLRAKLIECGWKDQLKAHSKSDDDFRIRLTEVPTVIWSLVQVYFSFLFLYRSNADMTHLIT
uniref:ENY2 transcription and export complex 2 subunit n=1 Tax=Podarcis muralis TaxID=64176 RepID=A0A670K2G4_PODMU